MEDIQDHMTESIATFKDTAGAYSEHLSSIKERIEKIKEEERQAKEEGKHDHKEEKNGPYCQCKIFLDLMKENDTEKELEVLHKELLQTNSDVLSTLSQESKTYSTKYQALKKEYKRNLELRMSTQKHILKCNNTINTSVENLLLRRESYDIAKDEQGDVYYPADKFHEQNFSYLVVDPLKRHVTVLYHRFGSSTY